MAISLDWTVIVSATYLFALALVLLLIFLRSYRKTKEKYSELLDDKEKRLSRMLLDVEDTMKALEDYADDVHKDWEELKTTGHDDYLDMQEQTVKLGASFVELQSQISALSMRISGMHTRIGDIEDYVDSLKASKDERAAQTAVEVDEELEAALRELKTYVPGNEVRAALDSDLPRSTLEQRPTPEQHPQGQRDEELKRVDELSSRTEEALKMLRAGRNILDTAKELGFSRGELELLSSRYRIK